MKHLFLKWTLLSLAATVGCTQGTPGGPGTTDAKSEKPAYGQADDTFNLTVPLTYSAVQQGGTAEVLLGIDRAKNFDQDVTLQFVELPAGVTVTPVSAVIKHGDVDTKVLFTAGDDATAGDYKVKVTGHSTKGGDAEVELKLTVSDKDTFTLSVPLLSTTLKQGGSQSVSVGINRDETFDQDVALQFSELPTGVTMEPARPMIKRGETEAKLVFTGSSDAALGNFGVTITGHPSEGDDAVSELKLTVAVM